MSKLLSDIARSELPLGNWENVPNEAPDDQLITQLWNSAVYMPWKKLPIELWGNTYHPQMVHINGMDPTQAQKQLRWEVGKAAIYGVPGHPQLGLHRLEGIRSQIGRPMTIQDPARLVIVRYQSNFTPVPRAPQHTKEGDKHYPRIDPATEKAWFLVFARPEQIEEIDKWSTYFEFKLYPDQ